MPSPDKIKFVKEIKAELDGTSGLVLADFKGLSVLEQDELRKKVDKEGGTAKVIKNTLLSKALEGSAITGLDTFLKNNTIVFSSKEDILGLLKVISAFSKTHEKFLLKGGFLDGQAFDKAGIMAMAQLPSRKELLAQIAGGMNPIIANFVGVLNGIMTSFTGTLEALEKKKGE